VRGRHTGRRSPCLKTQSDSRKQLSDPSNANHYFIGHNALSAKKCSQTCHNLQTLVNRKTTRLAQRGSPVTCLRIIALYAAIIPIVNCGGSYFVGFVSNPGGTISTTGTVSAVSNGVASDPSGTTPVTVVTFEHSGTAIIIYFCGDQQALFPLNQTVRADYTTGVVCSVLVQVVMIDPGNS